ncbi:ferredoxin-1 [Embleya scabrispora]|uniref:Ferredoxin n=1 Tax=Embleya scabrispora TaxID=159449 RepID=A0A1T3NRZ5_9ACTN|nr:(4Fe-4S)-binding protein [Embleya scabrispora]OPC79524.1 ferredoxin-1 [Embleya scabrispora]
MRVSGDRNVCVGAGLCALTAPELFDQDDDGLVTVLTPHPEPRAHRAARQAADLCPSGAVRVTEE